MNLAISKARRILMLALLLRTVIGLDLALGTDVAQQHATLAGQLGLPSRELSTDWINIPSFGIGLQINVGGSLGGTLAGVTMDGAGLLHYSQFPGSGTVNFVSSAGNATMDVGFEAWARYRISFFGRTVESDLPLLPGIANTDLRFSDNKPFDSYLLGRSVTLRDTSDLLPIVGVALGLSRIGLNGIGDITFSIGISPTLECNLTGTRLQTSAGTIYSAEGAQNVNVNAQSVTVSDITQTTHCNFRFGISPGGAIEVSIIGLYDNTFPFPSGLNFTFPVAATDISSSPSRSITFNLQAPPPTVITPAITSVSPAALPGLALPRTQRVTILGSGFSESSTLAFNDGTTTYPLRSPVFFSPYTLKYDIAVGTSPARWTVKVVNGTAESAPYPFYVVATGDTTAPGAPIGLAASPPAWANNNEFTVDWTNPNDPSGIAKVWWKIGAVPTSPSDGLSYRLPAYKPLPVSLGLSEGTQTIYVWLEDGVENKSHNNRATATLRLDVTRPTVSITSPTRNLSYSLSQNSITLSGVYADNLSGVTSVSWVNSRGGSGNASLTGNPLTGTWSTAGIAIYSGNNTINVAATDTAGNQAPAVIFVNRIDTSNSGSVSVTLGPQDAVNAGAQWCVNGGAWRNSGDSEVDIPIGSRLVEFKPINGYNTPSIIILSVTAGQTTSASAIYTRAPVNRPPYVPSNPTPANGTMDVSRSGLVVSWSGGDPDGPVQNLVKLGPTPDPEVRAGFGAVSGNSWPVDMPLEAGITYYWGIRAKDSEGLITDSPIWSFTTAYEYADLVPKGLSVDGTVRPGAQVAISLTVSNAGTYVAPGAYVHFYLSRSPGAKELRLTPNVPDMVPNLNPGQQQTVTFNATLNGLQAGTSYIDAWIDSGSPGPFSENNLANNIQSVPVNYVDGQDPEFTCAYLNIYGGGYGRTGEKRTITYCVRDDVGIATCDFYWSTDDAATWMVIQEGVVPNRPPQNGTTFEWTIPEDFQLTTNLWIKVIARDTSGNWAERLAGPYTVKDGTKPVVTVLSPNGGELWDMGTTHEIRWSVSAPNGIANMDLWFYCEGYADKIADIRSNTNGVFSWTLPSFLATTTGRVKIQVRDFNYNEAEDFSDGYFSIRDTTAPPPPPWTTPELITSLPAGDPGNNDSPRIAADGAGNLHMVYSYSYETYFVVPRVRHQTIYYTKRSGTNWSTPTVVHSVHQVLTGDERHFGYWLDNLRIGVDSQQRPHVLWQSRYANRSEYNRQDVFYAGYDGATWSAAFNLSADIRGPFYVNNLAWTNRANLPRVADSAACSALNGRIYVLGAGVRTSMYEFDPSANTWAQKADIPSAGISEGGAVTINAKVYAIGNPFDGRVKVYSPGTDSWTEGAAIPTRRRYPCVIELNGKMYVIGGWDPCSSKNEVYDPVSNSWATMADMPTARGFAAGAAIGGKIYIIGGESSGGFATSLIEVYDPQSNSWSTMVQSAFATWPRPRAAAVCATGGRIYVMGGRDPEYNEVSKGVFEYDPAANSWQAMQPLQTAKREACAAVIGNRIYVSGGETLTNGVDTRLDTIEEATITSTLTGMQSQAPDLVVDAADRIHVVWQDGGYFQPVTNSVTGDKFVGPANIHYRAKAPSQGWGTVTRLSDSGGSVPALASDAFTDVHLVYRGNTNLAYLMWSGGSWATRTPPIDCSDCSDYSFDLAADTEAHLHLALYCWNDYEQSAQILYRFYNGTDWTPPESIGSNRVTSPLILADSLSRPHGVWLDTLTRNRFMYRTKSRMGWETPIQLNLASQSVADGKMGDAALSLKDDQMHAVWSSFVNGNAQILYNHAYVGATNDVYPPSVSVTAPYAGRVLPIGSVYTVRWSAADNRAVVSVDLYYSLNGGTNWTTIATNEGDDGMYDWTVPSTGTNVGMVRVVAWDAAGNSGAGYSGTFTTADLTPPVVVVTWPTNGATLVGNATVSVTWSAMDNVGVKRIDLEYSLNSGASWFEMAAGLSNTGAYAWLVPNIETDRLVVRASACDDAGYAAWATSQAARIVRANNPPVPPHSPFPVNGAQFVPFGSAQLQWNAADLDGDPLSYYVKLGTSTNLQAVATNSQARYTTALLVPNTQYYWQIMVHDGQATTAGPIWRFMTAPEPTRIIALSGNLAFGNVPVGSTAQATLTIANTGNSAMTFGSISFPAGFSGAWSGDTVGAGSSQPVTVTFAPTAATNYGGNVTVNADQTSGTNTYAVSGTGVPAPATVVLNPGTLNQIYDGSPKVVTASTTPPGLALATTYNGNATPPTAAGTYTVVATVNNPNFAGSTNGTLTVTPAALTITASDRSKTYGQAVSFVGTEFTSSALPNSEAVGLVTLTSSGAVATAGVSGSPFSIVPSAATGGTFNPANYTISYQDGTLRVDLAALAVTADNKVRVHGATNPMFTGTVIGVQNSDNITANYACAATPASPAGPYEIVPTLLDPTGKLGNYSVTTNNGVLTVVSEPAIVNPTLAGSSFSLSVTTAVGLNYALEYKESLEDLLWAIAQTLSGTGGTITLTDGMATNTARFYRVRVE
jgi:N-acetylneuraminic acid mutarotase